MPLIGAIGFLSPWLLLGLLALPILWWLLRAVPPAAIRRRFPAVTLLLGLKDPESTPSKTPWWLLLLRMLALAAAIIGFAGPVLNPREPAIATGPLLILRDSSWAAAPDWARRQDKLAEMLTAAGRRGRPVAVVSLNAPPSTGQPLEFHAADHWSPSLAAAEPMPWEPDYSSAIAWLGGLDGTGFETIWMSDGLARDGRAELFDALSEKGPVSIIEADRGVHALTPPFYRDAVIGVGVLRQSPSGGETVTVSAYGPDPAGIERVLAARPAVFEPGARTAETTFDLPSELRNRITRFAIEGSRSAGAVALADDALKRRKVALFAGHQPREGQELISPLHYLKKALAPSAELIEAPVRESLLAAPDVVILADVVSMTPSETANLTEWVEGGGMLVRFAGPRLAAAGPGGIDQDPLLPVRLRAGGRNVGGAMSWGAPKLLMPFGDASPFFGLETPADVEISAQVIAEPDPLLAERTIASLQDGTPLVTRKPLGDGEVVLFHVTANAEWSSLPLSGLFVQMLERLAVSTRSAAPEARDLAGRSWRPERVLNGFGEIGDADSLVAVPGEKLAAGRVGPGLPPGAYRSGDRQVALNVIAAGRELAAAAWPPGTPLDNMQKVEERPLMAILLALALGALILDVLATLWISGRLKGPREAAFGCLLLVFMLPGPHADADDEMALRATRDTVLAYVKTGDAEIDRVSEAGLYGLSKVLAARTAVEPADPIAVDLENDELAFFPIIYWPISESQPMPSEAAYDRLNTYLLTGGMILFDTRDANLAGIGTATPNGRRLQQLAAGLNIPALEPAPPDHVLTRSFYLLQDFPGRYARAEVWVEAAPADAERIEGMPFRNLNDGVSPVLIGGNDWASAWALSRQGGSMFPVGRGGYAGERQREYAYRFGVNLVMYVLTGNYKSDQVHVPALLERLGQ